MKSVPILLNSTDKVLTFSKEVGKFDVDMDLEAGRSFIDAKSMLGIFSLNLSSPLTLHIYADEDRAEEIADRIEAYVV